MASDKQVFTARDGALFIQSAPNIAPVYFGGYDLDDISGDEGGINLLQQFDVNGDYEVVGYTQDAPSPIEFSLTGWLGKNAEYLERVKCPFYLHVNKRCGGLANLITNYDRAVVLQVLKKTNRTLAALVNRNDEAEGSEQTFDFSGAIPILDVYRVTPDRQTNAEPRAANDIALITDERCVGCAGPGWDAAKYGAASTDGTAGVSADVLFTYDAGANWSIGAADPFAVLEDIQPIVGFMLERNKIRWLVGRGTTDAGNPGEIAYTDFNLETDTVAGAAWTLANVGATNAQFFQTKKTIFVYDRYNLWGVTTGGYIYKSEDAGASWTAQESGVLSAAILHVVRFVKGSKLIGFVGGATNTLLRTLDGGVTWSALAGPSAQAAATINSLFAHDRYNIFLCYNDGELWRTIDGGLTWTQVTGWTGSGVGQVRDIHFVNDVIGYMIVNSAGPVGTVLFTRDCGVTWEALTTPTNIGLNSLVAVRSNLAYAVGEIQSATAVILKIA